MTTADRVIAFDSDGCEHLVLILSKEEAIYPDRTWLNDVVNIFAQKRNLQIDDWDIYYYGHITSSYANAVYTGETK